MSDAVKNSRINIFMNEDDHLAKIQRLETAYANLNQKLQGLTEGTRAYQAVSSKMEQVADSLSKVTKEHELGTLSIKKAQAAVTAYQNEIKNFTGSAAEVAAMKERYTEMTAELQKMKVEAGLAANKVEEIGIAGKATEWMKEQFLELVAPLAAAAGAAELLKKGFEEFNDTQLAVAMLRNTLQNIHQEGYMGELTVMTEKLREQFHYLSEKDIASMQDKLVTFGKLSKDQIAQLQPVIVDLAAKLGMTLPQATDKLLGAIQQPLKEFKELGLTMKEGKDVTERYGIVMDTIAPKVRGAAQTMAESNKGFWAGVKTDFDEAMVSMGRFITNAEGASIAAANSAKSQGESGEKMIAVYEELNQKTNLTTEEKEKLHKAETGLVSIFGDSIVEINKETGAMEINISKTKDLITQKLLFANGKAVEEASKYKSALDENSEATEKYRAILEKSGMTEAEYHKQLDAIVAKRSNTSRTELLNAKELTDSEKAVESLSNSLQPLQQNMLKTQSAINDGKEKLKELGFEASAVEKILSGEGGNRATPINGKGLETKDEEDAAKKAHEKLVAEFEKFEDEVAKIGGTADENQRAKLQEHYSKLLDEAQEFTKKHLQSDEKYMQEYDRIMGQWKSDLAALDKKEADEKLKKEEEAAKKEIELKKKLAEQFSSTTKAEYQQAKNDFGDYINSKRSGLEEDYANDRINKKEFDNSIRQLDIEAKKGELLIAQDYSKNDVQAQKDAVALKAGLIHSEVVEVQKTEQEKARIRKEITRDSFNALKELSAAFFSSQDSKLNIETKKWDAAESRKKTALDARLKAGKISQANYDKEIAKIDAETTARKNKDAHDQAVMKKKQAEFNAGIQLAEAIGSIWAEYPKFDGGIAMAVALGAAGVSFAAQIANIASMEIPPVNGYWTGTNNAAPGYAWVGEKGPELMKMKGGEEIKSHPESMRMVSSLPQMNYGAISSSMQQNRGNGGIIGAETFFGNMSSTMYKQGNENAAVLNSILQELKKGIEAKMSIEQWHDVNNKYQSLLKRAGANGGN